MTRISTLSDDGPFSITFQTRPAGLRRGGVSDGRAARTGAGTRLPHTPPRARVADSSGEPTPGLKPSDFIVKIDGKRAVVEAADWIADPAAQREVDEQLNGGHALSPVPSPGRLLVLLYQTDFARNDARVRGQMKLLQMDEWLDWIEPEDRVAVLSFDSHLKFRLDFTNNKHDIANAMEESLYISDPPWPQ